MDRGVQTAVVVVALAVAEAEPGRIEIVLLSRFSSVIVPVRACCAKAAELSAARATIAAEMIFGIVMAFSRVGKACALSHAPRIGSGQNGSVRTVGPLP